MSGTICKFHAGGPAVESGRGLPQSKTLARWPDALKFAERLGLRRPSAALVVASLFFMAKAHAETGVFFANGLAAAQRGEFSEAATAFEKSAHAQPSSGALVNLGIAEWQRGRAGAAIRAWEQARWIDPFDPRAVQNLTFARAVAQVEPPELRWFEQASTWLPPNAWLWLAGASLWLAVGALVLPRVWRWKKPGGPPMLVALGFCVFIFSLTANFGVAGRTDIGFVVKKNAPLQLTPTRGGEIISTLAAGEAARKEKTRGNYFFIRTATAAGWVARESFGLINE